MTPQFKYIMSGLTTVGPTPDTRCSFCHTTPPNRAAFFRSQDQTATICCECLDHFHTQFKLLSPLIFMDVAQSTKQ